MRALHPRRPPPPGRSSVHPRRPRIINHFFALSHPVLPSRSPTLSHRPGFSFAVVVRPSSLAVGHGDRSIVGRRESKAMIFGRDFSSCERERASGDRAWVNVRRRPLPAPASPCPRLSFNRAMHHSTPRASTLENMGCPRASLPPLLPLRSSLVSDGWATTAAAAHLFPSSEATSPRPTFSPVQHCPLPIARILPDIIPMHGCCKITFLFGGGVWNVQSNGSVKF